MVLPRLADVLLPSGFLAVLYVRGFPAVGGEEFQQAQLELIRRYTTFRKWQPDVDPVAALEQRGLFREQGRKETQPVPFRQSVDDYVESFHARASHSRQRMNPEGAAAFDSALRQLVMDRAGGTVERAVRASVVWGQPLRP